VVLRLALEAVALTCWAIMFVGGDGEALTDGSSSTRLDRVVPSALKPVDGSTLLTPD
jgi:hypothetical protein